MIKGFKKNSSFFIVMFLISGLFFEVKNISAAQVGEKQNQNFDVTTVIDVFYSSLRTVKNLNYYTNEKIVFVIAGQEVSFDIQAGHGNIFTPFKSVAAQINPVAFGSKKVDSEDKPSLSGFAKIIIENELYKNAKDVEVLKWLIDFKLNPVQLFTLKLLILINTARADGEWSRVIEEAFCLLFRLSQVEDLKFIDKNKRLSMYLPESVKAVLKDNPYGLVEFVDDLWDVLISNDSKVTSTTKSQAQVKSFVFRDQAMAELVFEQFKSYAEGNDSTQDKTHDLGLKELINNFIKPHGYGMVDMKDFITFRSDLSIPNNKFAQTMVGYEEFLFSKNSDKPADLINQINLLQAKLPSLIFAHDQIHDEYLVAYASQEMSLINTLKEMAITFCVSFKEYLYTKKMMLTKNDEASLKYKREFDAREKTRIELEKFVRTQDGKQLFNQIKNEIDVIVSCLDEKVVEQNSQESFAVLKSELEKLEKNRADKNAELIKWQKFLTLQVNKNSADVLAKIDLLKSDIFKIDAQISAIKNDINLNVDAKLGVTSKQDAGYEKDMQNLAKLYKMLEDKQKTGSVPSDKLLSTIKTLEDRIAAASVKPVLQKTISGKLAVRESIANLLDSKADELNIQIDSMLKELDFINNIEDRIVQELLLDETTSQKKAFAKQLAATARQIRQDNDKAKTLEAYRKAFASVGLDKISKDKLEQIDKLELEVGYIIDSEKYYQIADNVMANIMLKESFLDELVKDITKNSEQFIYVTQRLQDSWDQILSHSTHLKDNKKIYRYLWKSVPNSYKVFLRTVGITEQSLN